MTARGKIKNGKVILEDPNALPDGTEVEVRRTKKRKPAAKAKKPKSRPQHSPNVWRTSSERRLACLLTHRSITTITSTARQNNRHETLFRRYLVLRGFLWAERHISCPRSGA